MKNRKGVTLVELAVATLIGSILLSMAWNAFSTAKRSEKATSYSAAIRGSMLFERYLRRDLSSLDMHIGVSAHKVRPPKCLVWKSNKELSLRCAVPGEHTLVQRLEVVYEFKARSDGKYDVFRHHGNNSRHLRGVIVDKPKIWRTAGMSCGARYDYITIDFCAYDPAMRKGKDGKHIGHKANIFTSLRTFARHRYWRDYTKVTIPSV